MEAQNTWIELETRHTSGVYPKRPLAIVRGEGARVWDADGNEYIDCVGGQGAANLGHAHPDVARAIAEQSSRLISCPEIFYNDQRAMLLERLIAVTPAGMNRAFLCNSGTEAVEAALKFARACTGRPDFVAAMRGFHGRTMGALSATWTPAYRTPFEPLVPGFRHVPYNDPHAMEAAIGDDVAGVLLEVVQGEGGVHPADREYLAQVQSICRERGALLILDEVQTGYGRTGTFFACQRFGISPDLMPIAKSMAGGLPMGACLIGEGVAALPVMGHGSTFGGNPLACAAAIATIEVMQRDGLAERAEQLGSYLQDRLRKIPSPLIREVRGLGLLVGVELRTKVTPVLQRLQAQGVVALPAGGTVLRLLPPLVISESDLDTVVDAVAVALGGD
jgi:acetylornithine/LysW-gamma-L-lysine aminotransferase